MHRWGYAPRLETLAGELLGGPIEAELLESACGASSRLKIRDGFVCLVGFERLLDESRHRVRINHLANSRARAIAEEFSRSLVRLAPFVDCVALSGSVASGGYVPTDDIDLDLFVRNGTKYLAYAMALGLGALVALRHGDGVSIRKIICINVIWTRAQTQPFERNDEALAFELQHCRPLIGQAHFGDVIRKNAWVRGYFPQIARESGEDARRPEPSLLGRLLDWITDRPRMLARVERVARAATYGVYTFAHWLRRNDRAAMERLNFLKRAKYPYEVFQD